MTHPKSRAIELAEWLEGRVLPDMYRNTYRDAASELRRLDAVERESKARIAELEEQLEEQLEEVQLDPGWLARDVQKAAERLAPPPLDWSAPLQTADGDRLEYLCTLDAGTDIARVCKRTIAKQESIVWFYEDGKPWFMDARAINIPPKTREVDLATIVAAAECLSIYLDRYDFGGPGNPCTDVKDIIGKLKAAAE